MWGRPKDLRIFWKWCPCTRCGRKRIRAAEDEVFKAIYERAYQHIRDSCPHSPGPFMVNRQEWHQLAYKALVMSHSTYLHMVGDAVHMTFLGLRVEREAA